MTALRPGLLLLLGLRDRRLGERLGVLGELDGVVEFAGVGRLLRRGERLAPSSSIGS